VIVVPVLCIIPLFIDLSLSNMLLPRYQIPLHAGASRASLIRKIYFSPAKPNTDLR